MGVNACLNSGNVIKKEEHRDSSAQKLPVDERLDFYRIFNVDSFGIKMLHQPYYLLPGQP